MLMKILCLHLYFRKSLPASGVAFDFETIHNLDEYGCEFAPTVRDGMRSWNMTVQFWLAHHVYRRVPFKSNGLRYTFTFHTLKQICHI